MDYGTKNVLTSRDAERKPFPRPRAWLFLLLALVFSGCQSGSGAKTNWFDKGSFSYLEGNYRAAEKEFSKAAAASRGEEKYKAICWQGQANLELGNVNEAHKLFRRIDSPRSAGREIYARARTGEAQVLRKTGRYTEAETIYLTLSREYADVTDETEMIAAIVECKLEAGDYEGAALMAKSLSAKYPDSVYAKQIAENPALAARYVVQAGAFSDMRNAEALRRKMAVAGIETFIKKELRGRNLTYIVQAGAFKDKSAAETHAAGIKRKGFSVTIK
ncbi:MAG: SPOR domain-containing protein [Planctomycetes bacterium]|nr:SPOR domain-containing protein [Planctomycetota bacterium]